MINLLNLMYTGSRWVSSKWMMDRVWLIDRTYPYFHIAINHPDVNGVKKHSWKR